MGNQKPENPNLSLWDAVEKTDPDYTKPYQGPGGFTATSINAMYVIKRATEQFGPCGIGWGWDVKDERFDTGGPLTDDGAEFAPRHMIHTVAIMLWYIKSGERHEIGPIYGHTPFVYKNKYGIQTEPEYAKKSLTDALKKAFSMLGFAGDVFLGEYDDVNYLESIKREFEIVKADDKDEVKERQAAEYRDWKAKQTELLRTAVSMNELEMVFKLAVRKMTRHNDQKGIRELTQIKDERKKFLDGPKKAPANQGKKQETPAEKPGKEDKKSQAQQQELIDNDK